MAKPDTSIDPRISESAKREFLALGYEKASLKTICQEAGITTGALYKRYSGKEALFCAIVEPTLRDLNAVMEERRAVDPEALSDDDLIKAWDMTPSNRSSMLWWFDFLYQRKEGFVLLLTCADGTRYANFQHDWVEKMTQATYGYYLAAHRRGLAGAELSVKELHILLTAFWATIYEPFIHNCTWDEIVAHSDLVCKLFDWHKAMDFQRRG